jgi:hypothetical protein
MPIFSLLHVLANFSRLEKMKNAHRYLDSVLLEPLLVHMLFCVPLVQGSEVLSGHLSHPGHLASFKHASS